MPELVSRYTFYPSMFVTTAMLTQQCLVLFAVNIRIHRKLLAGTKQVLLGQNVFPLTSLKPGKKFYILL